MAEEDLPIGLWLVEEESLLILSISVTFGSLAERHGYPSNKHTRTNGSGRLESEPVAVTATYRRLLEYGH